MRAPCTPASPLTTNEDPFNSKWFNCLASDHDGSSEPMPLTSAQSITDFKRLCSPLYQNDQQPLCCNDEQLIILKQDLLAAEAVIGNCASCYLNFRLVWCQMTCSPNQSEFLIPRTVESRPRVNFTKMYIEHKEYKKTKNNKEDEDEDKKCDEKEKSNQHNNEDEDQHNEVEEETNKNHDTTHESETQIRRKRNDKEEDTPHALAVIDVEYHLSDEFLLNLIKSCR